MERWNSLLICLYVGLFLKLIHFLKSKHKIHVLKHYTDDALDTLKNPITLEGAAFFLPPGGFWLPLGDRGWMYRDPQGANGPCISVRIQRGSIFRATCLGSKGIIPFSLDEPQQGTLQVTLQLGSARRHCIEFGGDIRRDTSTAAAQAAVFLARNAPPGGCPAP